MPWHPFLLPSLLNGSDRMLGFCSGGGRSNYYAEVEINATRWIRYAEPRLMICPIINRMAIAADEKTRT